MKNLFLLLLFCLIGFCSFAQNHFYKTYPNLPDTSIIPIQSIENPDSSTIVLAYSDLFFKPYIFKIDKTGSLIWTKSYEYYYPFSKIIRINNGYKIFGADQGFFSELTLNNSGDSLSSRFKRYNNDHNITVNKVLRYGNGYAIWQNAEQPLSLIDTAFITLLDSNLNIRKEHYFTDKITTADNFIILQNQDLLLSYHVKDSFHHTLERLVSRYDPQLNKIWEFKDTSAIIFFSSLLENQNGDIFIVNTNVKLNGLYRFVKINPSIGTKLIDKTYSYLNYSTGSVSIIKNNQNGFVVCGTGQINQDTTSIILWNFDENCDSLWIKQLGESRNYAGNIEYLSRVTNFSKNSNGYTIIGIKYANNSILRRFAPFVLKTNFFGNITNISQLNSSKKAINIFPNPTNGTIFIKSPETILGSKFQVYDIHGKLIFSDKITSNTIELNHLKAGMYFIRINSSQKTFVEKMIIN